MGEMAEFGKSGFDEDDEFDKMIINKIITEHDKDGDGKWNFEEFCQWLGEDGEDADDSESEEEIIKDEAAVPEDAVIEQIKESEEAPLVAEKEAINEICDKEETAKEIPSVTELPSADAPVSEEEIIKDAAIGRIRETEEAPLEAKKKPLNEVCAKEIPSVTEVKSSEDADPSEEEGTPQKLSKELVGKAFAKADVGGTGKLTVSQLKEVLLDILDKTKKEAGFFKDEEMVNDHEVLKLFMELADKDGDEMLDLNELLTILELGEEKVDERAMFTKLMKSADKDGNGFISATELKNFMTKLKLVGSDSDSDSDDGIDVIPMMMSLADTNGDKKLSIEEAVNMFVGGPEEKAPDYDPNVENAKAMFRMYDTNGDGYISTKEIAEFMKISVDDDFGNMMINMIIGEHDEDGDGKLNYEEFCKWMNLASKKKVETEKETPKEISPYEDLVPLAEAPKEIQAAKDILSTEEVISSEVVPSAEISSEDAVPSTEVRTPVKLSKELVEKAFAKADVEGAGKLTINQLKG